MSRTRILIAMFLALVPALASAQDLIVYSAAAPGLAEETANGPAFPGPAVVRFPIPAPALPFMPFPAGDATMNNATGVITYTNGMIIAQVNDPAYPALAPVMAPAPFPAIFPLPLTGIALNSATGVLWVTNGVMLAGVMLAPGFPVVVPPLPFGVIIPAAAGPITGLDWDPTTGMLWAVTAAGGVYAFMPPPAFALVFGPIMSPVIMPGPATDIVIARDGAPGAATGIYVQTTAGTINYTTAIVSPLPGFIPAGTASGIAFHNLPDQLPGACACGGLFGAPVLGFTGPTTIGNAGFALTVSGVPAGSAVAVAIDSVFAPGGFPWPGGCTLYLIPTSATLSITTIFAGGGGVATLPVPIPGLPALIGATGFVQCGVPCALNPAGAVLTNFAQAVIGAP